MYRNFDIDTLRAVVAGADFGSFARAAVQLGRSQSTISMQLKKLEQQAGAPLFARKGRMLVPTEAGEVLIAYARRIVALNDETALAIGATVNTAIVRLGMPQDFFEDIMPATLTAFSKDYPHVHVDIRVGENHKLSEEIKTGRLNGAIAFFEEGTTDDGELLCKLPMRWLAHDTYIRDTAAESIPLVMFDHPCLFRKAALSAFDQAKRRWRMAVTTSSLLYVWSALRSNRGIGVRTEHGLPADIVSLDDGFGLPKLPSIELRLLQSQNASSSARDLCEILRVQATKIIASNGIYQSPEKVL
ncbi:MAG: LysR family transcriptional regulator [Hyphomicrobiales bacterium]